MARCAPALVGMPDPASSSCPPLLGTKKLCFAQGQSRPGAWDAPASLSPRFLFRRRPGLFLVVVPPIVPVRRESLTSSDVLLLLLLPSGGGGSRRALGG